MAGMGLQSPLLIFDIETIPDVELGRKLLVEPDGGWQSDAQVAEAMLAMQLEKTGGRTDFLRHHMHRIVALSVVYRTEKSLRVYSLGDASSSEADILRQFFDGIDKFRPILVGWNTGGFDLTVLNFRALRHGVQGYQYWLTGGDSKWDNYQGRYHQKHIDLMDVLGRYSSSAKTSLDEVATMLGFPGKLGMDGSKVLSAYLAGDIEGIRNYCEHDVLNTYLVFLRFELIRGRITVEQFEGELENLRSALKDLDKPHFDEFLAAWAAAS